MLKKLFKFGKKNQQDVQNDEVIKEINVQQNEDGIDTENRVNVGKKLICALKNNEI